MNLEEIRERIDEVDSQIIRLLSKRSVLVSAAGRLKKDEQGVRDPGRVGEVIAKVRSKAADEGMDPAIAEEIYRSLIGCFIRKELSERGAVSAEEGT